MKVDWTRDPVPTPPATFMVTLTRDEAETLLSYCSIGDAQDFRLTNDFVYLLEDEIDRALEAAAE